MKTFFKKKSKLFSVLLFNLGIIYLLVINTGCPEGYDKNDPKEYYVYFDGTYNFEDYYGIYQNVANFKKQSDNLFHKFKEPVQIGKSIFSYYLLLNDQMSSASWTTTYHDGNDEKMCTWAVPEVKVKSVKEIPETNIPEDVKNQIMESGNIYHFYSFKYDFSGTKFAPQEHRKFVLDSLHDTGPKEGQEVRNKTWKVSQVEATNSAGVYEDASDDEDLSNFLDNRYTFYKPSKLDVYAGTILSKEEVDFFEGISPNEGTGYKYTGTYNVTGTPELFSFKDVTLNVQVGNDNTIHKSFNIESAEWDKEIVLAYENQKTTYMQQVKIHLIPSK